MSASFQSPFQFRKLDDGTWQRREIKSGARCATLDITWVVDRRNKNRPKLPRWSWK